MSVTTMEQYGWDIVLTSAHLGARYGDGGENPGNHYWWQGRFFSRSGKDKRFPPFIESTGYGTGEGLSGWNCRHSFGPGDGEHNPWTQYDSEENRIAYDLSQQQRKKERDIRDSKLKLEALDAALETCADPETRNMLKQQRDDEAARLKRRSREYGEFCDDNGLKRQAFRLKVARERQREAGETYHAKPTTMQRHLTESKNSGKIDEDIAKEIRFGIPFRGNGDAASTDASNKARGLPVHTYFGLSRYLRSRYGITVDHAVKDLRFDDVRAALSGVDEVLQRYPEAAVYLKRVTTRSDGVMATTSDSICFNPNVFARGEDAAAEFANMVKAQAGGYWIRNANVQSLGYHEGGHLLEGLLTRIHSNSHSVLHWNDEWQRGLQADRIVNQACDNLRQTEYGQGMRYVEMRRDISRYSLKSKSETFAEAIADCFRNGENASQLSKEIFKIVDAEIMTYRSGAV